MSEVFGISESFSSSASSDSEGTESQYIASRPHRIGVAIARYPSIPDFSTFCHSSPCLSFLSFLSFFSFFSLSDL